MKTSINLYKAKYKPQLSLISLSSVTFFNVLTLFVFLALFVFLSWENGNLTEEYRTLSGQVSSEEKALKALELRLQARQPNPKLLAQIEQQKIALSQRQRLMEELSKREKGKMNRFSVVLSDLNNADTDSIWLTKIHINNEAVSLAGYGSTADAMPKWLANLSETHSFKGMAFEQAVMQRDDTALAFELNTTLADSSSNGGSR